MSNFDEELGRVLRAERKARKIYQPEIARRLGVSKMMVSLWENGKRTMSAEYLKMYCKALGITVQSVIDRTGD